MPSTGAPVPLRWPSEAAGGSFAAACEAAVSSGRPLHLEDGCCARLSQTLHLRQNRDQLRIIGEGNSVIEGSGHSVFGLSGRHARLELCGVTLRHTAPTVTGDGHDVGAALFMMGKSEVDLFEVTLSSTNGLGIWMVQSPRLRAQASSIQDCGRSGLAMFGAASAVLEGCVVNRCAVHGACARGRTHLTLLACKVSSCGRRGVYAYQSSTLHMSSCSVCNTQDASRAAVEVAGARNGDTVHARLSHCHISENNGAGLRVRGAVEHVLEGNVCRSNGMVDLHFAVGDENGIWPLALAVPTGS